MNASPSNKMLCNIYYIEIFHLNGHLNSSMNYRLTTRLERYQLKKVPNIRAQLLLNNLQFYSLRGDIFRQPHIIILSGISKIPFSYFTSHYYLNIELKWGRHKIMADEWSMKMNCSNRILGLSHPKQSTSFLFWFVCYCIELWLIIQSIFLSIPNIEGL